MKDNSVGWFLVVLAFSCRVDLTKERRSENWLKFISFPSFVRFARAARSKVGLETGRTRTHLFFGVFSRALEFSKRGGRHLTQSLRLVLDIWPWVSWAHTEGHSSLILQHCSSGIDTVVAQGKEGRRDSNFGTWTFPRFPDWLFPRALPGEKYVRVSCFVLKTPPELRVIVSVQWSTSELGIDI